MDILIRLGTVAGTILGMVLLVFGLIWFDEWSLLAGRLNRWARIVVVGPFFVLYLLLYALAALAVVAVVIWGAASAVMWVATGHGPSW